jgi:SAM-dependent methyltransferase
MQDPAYFMESEEEAYRLDIKTDPRAVEEQARWAGVASGMRVLDLGCGAGRTTHALATLVGPQGSVVGIDGSEQRISYASRTFSGPGVSYLRRDIRAPLTDLGGFDVVWIRFVLEYFADQSADIARNALEALRPGGTLCLIDLDHNCLGHFGASDRLERTLRNIVLALQETEGFDPFVGRKLYAYLYDLGCSDIEVRMTPHHLIYGKISAADRFNWLAKAEAIRHLPEVFARDYPGGYEEFLRDLVAYLDDPRRFIYTPLILCKGTRPSRR